MGSNVVFMFLRRKSVNSNVNVFILILIFDIEYLLYKIFHNVINYNMFLSIIVCCGGIKNYGASHMTRRKK